MIDRDEHIRLLQAFRAMPALSRCSGEDRCILIRDHPGSHLPRPHYPVSRAIVSDADWYWQEVERARARGRRAVANLAHAIRETCRCGARLHHSGYIAPGGIPVSLTTCLRCDRKDDDE